MAVWTLDTLIRNDFTLTLRADDGGYVVRLSTPNCVSSYAYKTFLEAKDRFNEIAEETDMVSLD